MTHMTKHEAEKQLCRLADKLDLMTAGNVFVAAHAIRAEAMRLDAISIRECNGVIGPDGFAKWDDKDRAKADKQRANAIARLKAIMVDVFPANLDDLLEYEFPGDPRGPSIKINSKAGELLATFY